MDKLEQMLRAHDWYYEYSDDHSVWTRWRDHMSTMRGLTEQLKRDGADPVAIEELWQKYRKG